MTTEQRTAAYTRWTSRKVFVKGLVEELEGHTGVKGECVFKTIEAENEFYERLDKYDAEHSTQLGSN